MPKPKPDTPDTAAAPTRDYIVKKGQLEKAGDMYDTGDTVPLTDAEAEHPLANGIVVAKDAPAE